MERKKLKKNEVRNEREKIKINKWNIKWKNLRKRKEIDGRWKKKRNWKKTPIKRKLKHQKHKEKNKKDEQNVVRNEKEKNRNNQMKHKMKEFK